MFILQQRNCNAEWEQGCCHFIPFVLSFSLQELYVHEHTVLSLNRGWSICQEMFEAPSEEPGVLNGEQTIMWPCWCGSAERFDLFPIIYSWKTPTCEEQKYQMQMD